MKAPDLIANIITTSKTDEELVQRMKDAFKDEEVLDLFILKAGIALLDAFYDNLAKRGGIIHANKTDLQ